MTWGWQRVASLQDVILNSEMMFVYIYLNVHEHVKDARHESLDVNFKGLNSSPISCYVHYVSLCFYRYILNTCVDPPHTDKVTGLTFQPPWKRHRSGSDQELVVYMAVTTSLDGQFKSWVLVDGGRREEEEEEGRKGKQVGPSWACRSVGYYHNLPCLGAAFSQDGSLLAINLKKVCCAGVCCVLPWI